MDQRLVELARKIELSRKKGNRQSLGVILECARILEKARAIAKRDFGRWLKERAHIEQTTAYRYLATGGFVRRNFALMQRIELLSLAKIYALSSLDDTRARRLLEGHDQFSAPLDRISDLQFRKEFRVRFPSPPRRLHRHNIFRAAFSALQHAHDTMKRASLNARLLTPMQRHGLWAKVRILHGLALSGVGPDYRETKSHSTRDAAARQRSPSFSSLRAREKKAAT